MPIKNETIQEPGLETCSMSELVKRLSEALDDSRFDDYDEIWLDAVETNKAMAGIFSGTYAPSTIVT